MSIAIGLTDTFNVRAMRKHCEKIVKLREHLHELEESERLARAEMQKAQGLIWTLQIEREQVERQITDLEGE